MSTGAPLPGFDWFGGVDFSGAKEPLSTLWTVLARPQGGKLRVVALRPHAFRADLAGYVAGGWAETAGAERDAPVLWGADFAFGLPSETARHLCGEECGWERLAAWVADRPAEEVLAAVPDELRGPRTTDARAGTPEPLGVRSFRQTVEGIRWLHDLLDRCDAAPLPMHPRAGAGPTLIETSPATTSRDLGLRARRAPGRPGQNRARIAALAPWVEFENPSVEATAVTLDDAWDAVLSCLTAWLVSNDLAQAERLAGPTASRVALEGWVYRPPAALENETAGRQR